MRKIEIATIGVVFGAVPIVICFLAGWWISIPFVPESWIFLCALAGLLVGLVVDLLFLKSWVQHAYSMKPLVWMMVYLFYSIGMFGFFMGVPVFNVALALPAGFFIGGWLAHSGADFTRVKKVARHSAVFTACVLALVCIASATIALTSSSTAFDLGGMFRLPFQITPAMIIAIIAGGGIAILILQWWLTFTFVERAYKYFIARIGPSTVTRSGSR
jgi:hypothetical protein